VRTTWYIARRFGELAIVFFGVTFIIYAMVFGLPGDPIASLGGDRPLPESVVAQLRSEYHLDQPLWQQYLNYLANLFQGDLGRNFSGQAVADKLADRWPVTITLALTAWGIEVLVGVALGLWAGVRNGRWDDKLVLTGTILASSIPVFVLAVSAQLIFGVHLGWFPVAGASAGWPVSYLLPALCVAVFGLAAVARLMRGSVIDALNADYVRTLWAKGMRPRDVIGVHVMRNSALPVLTFLAIDLGYLLGGTVVIEGVFNLPGVGQLLFQSIRAHEGPTIIGISVALIIIFLIANLIVDLLHTVLDPRIRHE